MLALKWTLFPNLALSPLPKQPITSAVQLISPLSCASSCDICVPCITAQRTLCSVIALIQRTTGNG